MAQKKTSRKIIKQQQRKRKQIARKLIKHGHAVQAVYRGLKCPLHGRIDEEDIIWSYVPYEDESGRDLSVDIPICPDCGCELT